MALSATLGLIAALGFCLLLTAIWLTTGLGAARRRAAALRRFSGQTGSDVPLITGIDGLTLRRDQADPGWLALLTGSRTAQPDIMPRHHVLILVITVTTSTTLLAWAIAGKGLAVGCVAGLFLSLAFWVLQLRRLIRRRAFAIEEALPEAMDLIVRSLRVGLAVGAAVQSAGKELSGPIATEFSETSARISYGQEPVSALRDMASRTNSQGLQFFAAAVAIQTSTGGNLAEVLERLAAIARGRQQLRRKIRSITAEAKWSGRFLSLFPIGAVIMLLTINPLYFSEISDKPFFLPMLGIVGALLFLNMIFMHWLVKVE